MRDNTSVTHFAPRLAVLASLLGAGLAAAQTAPEPAFTRDTRLLLWEGTLRGSPRLMGIGGAYVGLAEGAEGVTRNPAAAAMKDPKFASDFNVDFAAALHFLPPWATTEQDWDNDGSPDQASAGPAEFLGTQVIYLVASVQYKNVALGLGVDLQNFLDRAKLPGETFERYHNVMLTHAFGVLAASFWRDQILAGVGVESTHAFIGYGEQPQGALFPSPKETMGYNGWGVQFGGVWRPEDQDWRVGFSWRPWLGATQAAPMDTVGGKLLPARVEVPGRLSVGGAFAFGWGRKLNITSRGGWALKDEKDPASGTPAMTKFLLTGQLDIFFPVQGATTVNAFLNQPDVPSPPAGYQLSFQPRLGLENELVADLLRLRLGGYVEPPMVTTGPARPHLTFGVEVYLFKLGHERICFGLSFDFAHRYQNLSVGFLVWK